MVQLLCERKRDILAVKGFVTEGDFEEAWAECWQVMVSERAWPHATAQRRWWRAAMEQCLRPEARACFLDAPSAFQHLEHALLEAMTRPFDPDEATVLGQLVA